jgi:spore maturation protein CgeB
MLLAAWSINNPNWIINQAYNIPLRKIFKEVTNFDPQEELLKHGKDEMNRMFLDVLKKEKPDYIHLFLVWDEFHPETLVKIKEILPNVKVTHWNGDDDIKFDNYTIPYSPAIDYQFISQLQFTKRYDEYHLPWFDMLGADTDKFRPINLKKKYDVIFIGTPKGDRLKYMQYLLKKNVNFVIGGAGWEDYPEFKSRYLGKIPDEDFIKVINESKINLCFSQNFFSSPHVLERTLAVNACKAFALTEYVEGYFPKFTEGKDIVTFKSEEELYNKINYYLKNEKERDEITTKAYKKVTKNFSNINMMSSAYYSIEKDKKELASIHNRKYLKIKPVYLTKDDFRKGEKHLKKIVANSRYVCFKSKNHENLPYRDFFQTYTMELLKRPISICNSYLSSNIIGDYACLDVYYSYKYLNDKSYFYDNLDISQFMVEKDFFLKNIDKFAYIYDGKNAEFINYENTSFISMPLIRTTKIKPIPLKDFNHILFPIVDDRLIILRNQKRLFKDSYLYRLIFYSVFVNPQILKHLLLNVSKRTKSRRGIKVSEFFDKVL